MKYFYKCIWLKLIFYAFTSNSCNMTNNMIVKSPRPSKLIIP